MDIPPKLKIKTTNHQEIEKLDSSLFWKIKGISSKIMYKLFFKYANSLNFESEDFTGKINMYEFST